MIDVDQLIDTKRAIREKSDYMNSNEPQDPRCQISNGDTTSLNREFR
jgi:hypothetical protein